MRRSRLPAGGVNALQQVRDKRTDALARGMQLLDLSIGEPKGPALASAREAAQRAVMRDVEALHAYQYNASPGVPDFAERFVAAHVPRSLTNADVAYLPVPGLKPILGLLPLSCGCATEPMQVGTMTSPGYPIPSAWCAYHPLVDHFPLPLNAGNAFRFSPTDVPADIGLLMLNYPHNPSGQVADTSWWASICEYCVENDIRLFNDAAYCVLSHTSESATLSEVAPDFPQLSWCEGFTAAKLIGNGTGWHVGAMVGSPDFIADLGVVKANTDTGFVAPMAVGALASVEEDQSSIAEYRTMYQDRLERLASIMQGQGMRLALTPQAGFFTLWETPVSAFGATVESAQAFNFRMIEETGVVGVHLGQYMRYAVCADVASMSDELEAAFARAAVGY